MPDRNASVLSLITHIKNATDVEPWAKNLAENLLTRYRPVKPVIQRSGSGVTWWYSCGACKSSINPNSKFCQQCGKAVERDENEML